MKYRHINTDFWLDDYIAALSPIEKMVFAYLFTNERVNMCGIYQIPDRYITFVLGINQTVLDATKQKFESDRKYFFYKGWVMIVNNHKHVHFSTAKNIVTAYEKEFNRIPFDIKDYLFSFKGLTFIPPFDLKKIKIILNKKMEMVIEMEREMESRVGGTLGKDTDVMNEDVDPDEIDRGLRLMEQLKSKSTTN